MMEKRILVSAVARKEWTFVKKNRELPKTVAVALGDHRKIDAVKTNGNFDEDDFHAINELKKALNAGIHSGSGREKAESFLKTSCRLIKTEEKMDKSTILEAIQEF